MPGLFVLGSRGAPFGDLRTDEAGDLGVGEGTPAGLGRAEGTPAGLGRAEASDTSGRVLAGSAALPALSNDRWPWPGLGVFVLTSHRPAGTPDDVVTEADPTRLLVKLRAANRGW